MAKKDDDIFESRAPFNSYKMERISEYKVDANVFAVEKTIDLMYERLKKQGMDAMAARLYVQSYVNEYVAKLINVLDIQHTSHHNNINRLFVQRKADKKEFEDLLCRIDEQINLVNVDYAYVEELYKNSKEQQKKAEKIIESIISDTAEEVSNFETV